jgi:uncharacterized tellurite resistance protein B-like protein
MTINEKIGLIKQLYQMLIADNQINQLEVNFLIDIATSLDLPLEVIENLFDQKEYYDDAKLPKQINERIIQIYRLSLMLKIDGKLSKEELQLLKNIAIALGLQPAHVNVMLEKLFESRQKLLTEDELWAIFQQSAN